MVKVPHLLMMVRVLSSKILPWQYGSINGRHGRRTPYWGILTTEGEIPPGEAEGLWLWFPFSTEQEAQREYRRLRSTASWYKRSLRLRIVEEDGQWRLYAQLFEREE